MDHLTKLQVSDSRLPMHHPVMPHEIEIGMDTYIEPWIGWRSWNVKVNSDTIRLESITYRSTWNPEEEFIAQCINFEWNKAVIIEPHHSPNKFCGCGVYAVKTKNEALKWCDHSSFSTPSTKDQLRCFGEVKLWGTVYRYTRGFLAQKAYPQKILVPAITPDNFPIDSAEAVHELRRAYRGVDVRLF